MDVITFGSDDPRRRPRWPAPVAGLVLAALLVAGVVVVSLRAGPAPGAGGPAGGGSASAGAGAGARAGAGAPTVQPCLLLGTGQNPPVPDSVAGLRFDRADGGLGSGLDRCDRAALDGPWTVAVRRPDGSFGRRGAVVTFPVDPPAGGRAVTVGGVTGLAAPGAVTWPVDGRYARIRGDQGEADLVAIAARTTVSAGHPVVDPPAGFVVVAAGPYRPPSVRERRFGTGAVGEADALGNGLTFTGVASGGGYEDLLYTLTVRDGQPVDGRPTVVSSAFGGNATIAWEPAPGLIAFVGYSGSETTDAAVAALQRLAAQTGPLTEAQWREAGAQTVDQTNEPG